MKDRLPEIRQRILRMVPASLSDVDLEDGDGELPVFHRTYEDYVWMLTEIQRLRAELEERSKGPVPPPEAGST